MRRMNSRASSCVSSSMMANRFAFSLKASTFTWMPSAFLKKSANIESKGKSQERAGGKNKNLYSQPNMADEGGKRPAQTAF